MTEAERVYVQLFTDAVLAAVERGTREYFEQLFVPGQGDPLERARHVALSQFTDDEGLPLLSAAEVKRYIAQRGNHEEEPDGERQAPELRCLPGGKAVHECTDDSDE